MRENTEESIVLIYPSKAFWLILLMRQNISTLSSMHCLANLYGTQGKLSEVEKTY